LGSN
jgi:flagellar protein FlaC